ncbi:Glycoside hydrolase, partial [Rhypophila decipiens]
KFFDAISQVTDFLEASQNKSQLPGMWPKILNLRDKTVSDSLFTLGGQADSMHALLGGCEPRYAAMYRGATDTARKHLTFRPMVPDADTSHPMIFTGDISVKDSKPTLIPDFQHLSCFVGGMFGLAGRLLKLPDHVSAGE